MALRKVTFKGHTYTLKKRIPTPPTANYAFLGTRDGKNYVVWIYRWGAAYRGKVFDVESAERSSISDYTGRKVNPKNSNPMSLFKKYYVTCDGKKFGPYHTMAKAKKVAETVARVLDKPAKILGAAATTTNPKRKANPKRKRAANGGGYTVKGVSIGVPRYSFDPKAGDTFYVSGKTATIKRRDGDYVHFKGSINGITSMSVSNLYQVARVPTSSRFAPYGQRTNPRRRRR